MSSNRPPLFHQQRFAGRGRRNLNGPWRRKQAVRPSSPPPLGNVYAMVYQDDLQPSSRDYDIAPRISNSEYLTSYSWLAGKDPCIAIPGEPAAWTPLIRPTQLHEDSGVYFRDQNAARYPQYPLEPAVQAMLIDRSEFSGQSADIVACGSTLGNLLRFVSGVGKPFRMLIEVIDGTVFFIRRENSPTELIRGVHGFGHAFPEAYTTWTADVKGSESHQRVMKYDFAGMRCLMRFEADGFLPDLVPKDAEKHKTQPSHGPGKEAGDLEDDLLSSIKDTTVSSALPEDMSSGPLKVKKRGKHIPQSAVFELKTRAIWKKDNNVDTLGEQLPRMWIAQIPNFILAYHKDGVFNDIQVHDVRDGLKEWEEAQQPILVKLAVLLRKIVSLAQCSENGRLEITRRERSSVLELREQCEDAGRALPPHIAAQWH